MEGEPNANEDNPDRDSMHHANQSTTHFRSSNPSVPSQALPLMSLVVSPNLKNTRQPNPPRTASIEPSRRWRRDVSLSSEGGPDEFIRWSNNRKRNVSGDHASTSAQPPNKRGRFDGNSNSYRMGFKILESISKIENPDDVLKEIRAQKMPLLKYLDCSYNIDDCDRYVLLLKILSNVEKTAFTEMKAQLLLDITKSKFCENLQTYFTKLPYQNEMEKQRNKLFWDDPIAFFNTILTFCESVQTLSPNCAFQKCRPLIDLASTLCIPILKDKHDVKLPEENAQRLEAIKEKFAVFEKQPKDSKKYGLAPENFRALSVFPTAEDLFETRPYLRPNIINGSYESVEHYLDVQFRLLREDCYGPLRIGIQQFRKDMTQRKYDNIRVYRNVVLLEPMMTQNQFGVLVKWNTSNKKQFKKINWEQTKRLMYGSLVVFMQDNCRNVIIGTVLNRDAKILSEGLVVIQLYDVPITDTNIYKASYSMLECQVYFEPYLHVLKVLQDPEFSKHMAMSKYIVSVNHIPAPPAYLTKSTVYRLNTTQGRMNFVVLDDKTWPSCQDIELDASQYEAFKAALTQEFVVIQGPPGTGKTFLGSLIAKVLLKSFDVLTNFDCRLLILCYTNHALDQFLERILRTTESIVRIGGQSRNSNLDQLNLKHKRKFGEKSQIYIHARRELEDANSKLAVCQKNINLYNDGVYSYKSVETVFPDVLIINNYPGRSQDPLFNWLFEHAENVQKALAFHNSIAPNNNYEGTESDDATFSLDDVGVDADRQLFYENNSDISSCFSIENTTKKLNELLVSHNELRGDDYEKKSCTESSIVYQSSCLSLFQEMIKARNQLQNLNIKPVRWPHEFSTEERWSFYFKWAAQIKENLIKDFQSLKIKQEEKFEAYEEVRMMMDLQILRDARVVGVTTTGAARMRKLLQAMRTPIVIVEEAAEVLESHIIAALNEHCQHLILIGDHQQLRPSASNFKLARHFNMEVSLFERMVVTGTHSSTLRIQRRMRPEIAALIAPAIYADLQNHPQVLNLSDIRGLVKNLYFFTHDNREQFEEESLSRSNVFEAEMMLRLANYLVQQGYQNEDITILTTYTTQMFYMRNNRSKYPHTKDVKMTVVDKYQGEESKIILLSLVRNNEEGEIGFLATDNRVCVALSRAKEGMYIMGNIEMLKNKSELWTKIAATLESNGSLGTSFQLKCEIHPDNITEVHTPEDFMKVPEGGCLKKCDKRLECSHVCPRMCHIYDREHKEVKCIEKCQWSCPLQHPCSSKCAEPCPPCMILVTKKLSCKHTADVRCHTEPATVKCFQKVTITLPACGHETRELCYVDVTTVKCPTKCKSRLNCGHTCGRNCHKNYDPDHEKYQCRKKCTTTKLGCTAVFADGDDYGNHKCFKMCYEKCTPCDVLVTKRRKECGHIGIIKCSEDIDAITCVKKCGRILMPCKHVCRNECSEPCVCLRMVSKVIPDCGHEVKTLCSSTPTRADCVQKCERTLACGHACTLKCSRDCDCDKTTESPIPMKCGHTTMLCSIYLKGLQNQDPLEVMKKCLAPCNTELACGHMCAGTCGRCRQGRLHVPCAEPCKRTLICGHVCEDKCNVGCPPCSKQCEVTCQHNRCPEKCGVPCVECKEPCGRACPHGQCSRTCGAPCAVPPCDERCPRKLECGHRCVGLCGEPCPPLCPACRPDDLPLSLLGGYDEGELFIVLKDCGHSIAVAEADMMMQVKLDGEVTVRACPACRKPIINTSRYKDIVNQTLKDEINPIKTKMFGDEKGIYEKRQTVGVEILKLGQRAREVIKPFHAKSFTGYVKVVAYIQNNKKLSLPNLNVLTILMEKFQIIYDSIEEYKEKRLTEYKEYFLGLVDVLLSCLNDNLKTISEQRQRDVNNEIRRVRCVVQLATLEGGANYRISRNEAAVQAAHGAAADAVTSWQIFDETKAMEALKALEIAVKENGVVKKAEIDLVVRAMDMKKGQWFKCPNGHFYCIGECGGAMERGRCPDCGAAIGGGNHTLAAGNQHASEIDGSSYPAWSEQANMANYIDLDQVNN